MSIRVQSNIDLKPYNTLKLNARARHFYEAHSIEDCQAFLAKNNLPVFVLGGGSNVLFSTNVDAVVLRPLMRHHTVLTETLEEADVEFGAGLLWHEAVTYAVENELQGIENLALIPGLVGAAPVQNIGAYGVELKDVFVKLDAINIKTGQLESFDHASCQFGYRDSIFKQGLKGQFVIVSVTLRLRKKHQLNTQYRVLGTYLAEHHINTPTMDDVFSAVINIRQSKLPDPAKIPNAGSFFKNPVVPIAVFEALLKKHPDIPHYAAGDTHMKLAAAWLIEQAGFKGYRSGHVGMHDRQALVMITDGHAAASECIQLKNTIIEAVHAEFGVVLEPEVNII